MYSPLPEKLSYPALETEILKFWNEQSTFQKSLSSHGNGKPFTFFEGPPTVNGKPGIHHVMSRTLKDLVCRYKTMKGFNVQRKAGWDTHGLPVEIALEKELGFKQKSDIDTYGVAEFNAKAKALVYQHIDMQEGWRTLTERMGYWVNLDEAYITCSNDYIESVWWALKEFWHKDLIYKGFKIVPQCPHCETPLSSHELAQGYEDVKDPSVFVKLRVTSYGLRELPAGARILVWTTTPWTLISNIALAVNPEIEYVAVRVQGEVLVLAKARLSVLEDKEFEVLASFTGADLAGTHYEPLFDFVEVDRTEWPNAYSVVLGDFVSTGDGSGVVHVAPAFGQDDYEMSRLHNLPVLQPVTKGGRFIGLINDRLSLNGHLVKTLTFAGQEERGTDKEITNDLNARGLLWNPKNKTVGELLKSHEHSYPHCWRCDNPLIYYARDSWFIRTTSFAERMVELNKTIDWHPPEIGAGRFGNWLEENKDWSLSRDRYWGTPLPIWICESCGSMKCVGSIDDLSGGWVGTKHLPDPSITLDLHKPFVDSITFTCVKCNDTMRRTPELIDVWFDSGSMPFAQWHYPFENKEIFAKSFPADYICEGIDQTRGWFYTLHAISTALFDKPAFKHIIVNEMILDKAGRKMSKSKGNVVDPFKILDAYGADATRWYLVSNSPPWRSTSFNEADIADIQSNFFRALTNTYAFFALYANIDEFTYDSSARIDATARPEIDRWILSRLNTLISEYTDAMDNYDPTRAVRLVSAFTIEELSNWYVRRNRRRFWKGERDADKTAAYQTLFECLCAVAQMAAPVAPFLADFLYGKLRTDRFAESVHLTAMPVVNEFATTDTALEEQMGLALQVVALARSLREKAKLKTRQPLPRVLIPVRKGFTMSADIAESIREEINIKKIEYVDSANSIVKKKAKANFKALGASEMYRPYMKEIAPKVAAMTQDEIVRAESVGSHGFTMADGTVFGLATEMFEIQNEGIEGWLVASAGGVMVALDTALDLELISEGHAREFVSHVQKMRKERGFEVTDRIIIFARSSLLLEDALRANADYIRLETLAREMHFADRDEATALDVNGESCRMYIVRDSDTLATS